MQGFKESGNSPGEFLELYFCCVPIETFLFDTSSTSFLPQDQSGNAPFLQERIALGQKKEEEEKEEGGGEGGNL